MDPAELVWKFYRNQLSKNTSRLKADRNLFKTGGLILLITTRCNFACRHCMRDPQNTVTDMPFEIAQKAILGAKKYNYRVVSLTGGEPLLYPRFKELVEFIVANGYFVNMATNGYNFRQFSEFLKRHKEKIDFVQFSLEDTDKKKHDAIRREGSFERLLEDFEFCRESKIRFSIITVINPLNYDRLFDIAIFAKKKGARFLKVATSLPCPRTQDNDLILSADKRKELFLTLFGLSKILKIPIQITSGIRGMSSIRHCPALNMTEISVNAEGNIMLCCDMANFDSDYVQKMATVTSLENKSFDDALKILSEYVHRICCQRIEDYKTQADPLDVNFNSCFYCLRKL